MSHLIIPLDGVPIVPDIPTADFVAADGWVVFVLSVRQFYAYNQSLGVWQPAGGGIIVADTDSIDLTDTLGTLTADVRISTDAAPVGNVKATITVQSGASPGLLAVVAESDIQALFSATDTDSVDLSYTAGAYSADVKLSADAADTGYQKVDLNVQSGANAGLRAQLSDSAIQNLISVTDTDTINFSYSSGAISGDVLLSTNAADAGYRKVDLNVETTTSKGIRAQIADTSIQGAITVSDTDAIDLTYTSGAISGTLFLSAAAADANNQKVNLDIQTGANKGLRAQIPNSSIQSAISITDTNSVDLTYSGGAISADLRLSSDAADVGYILATPSIQSGASKGLRVQVQSTFIQGLFSASAPIQYNNGNGAFTFDTATTTLTAYLLKTGGTMTGAIVSSIPYANTGVVSTALHPAGWIDVSHLQSATLTFDVTKGEAFAFTVTAAGHAPLNVRACFKHSTFTVMTDQDNKYLEADSGTGWYLSKSTNSAAITIKQRLGGTHKQLVNITEGVLSSATAWA